MSGIATMNSVLRNMRITFTVLAKPAASPAHTRGVVKAAHRNDRGLEPDGRRGRTFTAMPSRINTIAEVARIDESMAWSMVEIM